MKRFVSLVFILLPLSVFAQHHVSFTYDASGNRNQSKAVTVQQKANSKEANTGSADKELSTGEVLKVYCDKANDKIVIRLLKPIDGKCSYTVFTTDGSLVHHGKVDSMKTMIEMSGMTAGIYILKISIGDKQYSWKIAKK